MKTRFIFSIKFLFALALGSIFIVLWTSVLLTVIIPILYWIIWGKNYFTIINDLIDWEVDKIFTEKEVEMLNLYE